MKESLKKVLNYALLALLIVPCAFFLVACGETDTPTPTPTPTPEETATIAGNYVFDGISVGWTDDATVEQKAAILDDFEFESEAEFFAFFAEMMPEEMGLESVNSITSLEVSGTTNRAFMLTEGFDVNFVATGNIYKMTSENEETSRRLFSINGTEYSYYYSTDFSLGLGFVVDDGTDTYPVTNSQFTIGDTTYTLFTVYGEYDNEIFIIDGSVYEEEDDVFTIDEKEYTVSILNSTVTYGTDTYTITDGQFTIGDTTYTVNYEIISEDIVDVVIYFSYDEDTSTVSIYEDPAMTIAADGDGVPDSLDVNGNTISFSMLSADMDGPAGLEITMNFTKSA